MERSDSRFAQQKERRTEKAVCAANCFPGSVPGLGGGAGHAVRSRSVAEASVVPAKPPIRRPTFPRQAGDPHLLLRRLEPSRFVRLQAGARSSITARSSPATNGPTFFSARSACLHQPFFKFRQRGRSGLWISDLFPHLAGVADELTLIRSMFAETSNHTPATFQANTGFRLNGFPVLGSWLSYGLGCETDDLPTFVVLPDVRGVPAGGSINWAQRFSSGSSSRRAAAQPRNADRRSVRGSRDSARHRTREPGSAEPDESATSRRARRQRCTFRADSKLRAGRQDAIGTARMSPI